MCVRRILYTTTSRSAKSTKLAGERNAIRSLEDKNGEEREKEKRRGRTVKRSHVNYLPHECMSTNVALGASRHAIAFAPVQLSPLHSTLPTQRLQTEATSQKGRHQAPKPLKRVARWPIRPHCLPHPTGADPVALSPINPLLYSRIFPSLTNRPPRTYSIIPCWSKQASIKDLKASPSSQHRILIDQLSAVCQEELHAALVKQLIKSQIALLESVPVIRFPCHPPAPPLHHFLDHCFEGLQMADNRRRTLKERVKPGRRMFSLCNVLQ